MNVDTSSLGMCVCVCTSATTVYCGRQRVWWNHHKCAVYRRIVVVQGCSIATVTFPQCCSHPNSHFHALPTMALALKLSWSQITDLPPGLLLNSATACAPLRGKNEYNPDPNPNPNTLNLGRPVPNAVLRSLMAYGMSHSWVLEVRRCDSVRTHWSYAWRPATTPNYTPTASPNQTTGFTFYLVHELPTVSLRMGGFLKHEDRSLKSDREGWMRGAAALALSHNAISMFTFQFNS